MLLLGFCLAVAAPSGELEVADASVGASDKEVTRAERMYEEAKYEKALKVLKKGCANAADPVRCERVKAFIHIALGEMIEARAAFDRMLVHDPDASLGPDISPKLQGMFADAKRSMVDVQSMRLEPLITKLSAGVPILLEVKNPTNSAVELLSVSVAAPGSDRFDPVDLKLQGEIWSGSWVLEDSPGSGRVRYFLSADLAGEVQVPIGSESTPFEVDSPGTDGGGAVEDTPVGPVEEGLPGWAPWAIGGGIAAVVATVVVVVAVVVAGQEPAPGSVEVNILFFE